jgi:hypothetical protein
MPIPCPKHSPRGWALYQSMHGPRVDWTREAEIARGCCAACDDEAEAVPSPSNPDSKSNG